MADALRQLLAEFFVSIDPNGDLAKGNAQIDALKAAAGVLEERLGKLAAAARPAAKAVSDVFSKAGADAAQFLQVQQAKALGGRANDDGFAALGALRPGGPQLGPTREHFAAQQKAAEAYANSLRGRLSSAFESARRSADTFKISGSGILDTLTSMRTAVLGLATGAAARFTLGLVEHIGGIGEAAAKLGVATDEFQRLDVLAKQNATSVEALGGAFRNLAKLAVDPTKDSTTAFGTLGVSTKVPDGQLKSRQDLFFDTAAALADVSNETKRAALAQQLFGRSGLELLPLLSQGRAGLEGQREALAKMAVVSESAIKAADEFDDRWQIIKAELLAKVAPLLERFVIPAIEKLADFVVSAAKGLETFANRTDLVAAAVVGLGLALSPILAQLPLLVALGGGWVRTLGGMAIAAGRAVVSFARLALPFLLLEDVFGFFSGADDSLTGRLMIALFGEDGGLAIQQAAYDVYNAIKELWDFVSGKGVGPAMAALGKDFGEFFARIGKDPASLLSFTDQAIAAGPGAAVAGAVGGAVAADNRQQSITVNVNSASEVQTAVTGAQRALGRDAAADLAAVGG